MVLCGSAVSTLCKGTTDRRSHRRWSVSSDPRVRVCRGLTTHPGPQGSPIPGKGSRTHPAHATGCHYWPHSPQFTDAHAREDEHEEPDYPTPTVIVKAVRCSGPSGHSRISDVEPCRERLDLLVTLTACIRSRDHRGQRYQYADRCRETPEGATRKLPGSRPQGTAIRLGLTGGKPRSRTPPAGPTHPQSCRTGS